MKYEKKKEFFFKSQKNKLSRQKHKEKKKQ